MPAVQVAALRTITTLALVFSYASSVERLSQNIKDQQNWCYYLKGPVDHFTKLFGMLQE